MIRKALGTIIGGVLALTFIAFVPHARADARDQATQLTFSQPIQLPNNMVLPAGSYWFVQPDVNSSNVVQVFNGDRTQLIATLETIATERPLNMTGSTQLTFGRVANQPPLLVGWIYPGQTQGHEFVYSPQKESQLFEAGKLVTVQLQDGGQVTVG